MLFLHNRYLYQLCVQVPVSCFKPIFLMMQQHLSKTSYINPLTHDDFPDASILEVKGKGYFAYATHDEFSPSLNNVLVKHSWDLINWSASTGALLSPPDWARLCHRFWCPQVVRVNNEFRLYYA